MAQSAETTNAEAKGSAVEAMLEEAETLVANLRAGGASRADFAAALKEALGSAAADDVV